MIINMTITRGNMYGYREGVFMTIAGKIKFMGIMF